MKKFNDSNFLLQNKTAEKLYHEYAEDLPIIDYHCHLNPQYIAQDKQFNNLTQLWLEGDHYKWRAMRTNGVDERYLTGDASDWEKFQKWAETVPYAMRNPLYHWVHLELKTAFGITKLLNKDTAKEIYDECNEKLGSPEYTVRGLLKKYKVEVVCTTDDPIDNPEFHVIMRNENSGIKMLPTWRPDKAMTVEIPDNFKIYIDKLSQSTGKKILKFRDLIDALQVRHDMFASLGCKLSDHGIEEFYVEDYTISELDNILTKVYSGNVLTQSEILKFKSAILYEGAVMDFEKGWTQQFHFGVIRNNNTRMFLQAGPDTGFDSIGDFNLAKNMSKFLNRLDKENKLAKTILYNLNPRDNDMIAAMIGNFQDGSCPGKIQFGSGWWFLDQKFGIESQLNSLSSLGLLSRFVGMLTDSRSFLSFPRHEYFRRILCNLLGKDIEEGLIPESEINFVGNMVQNISYYNAKNYFKF